MCGPIILLQQSLLSFFIFYFDSNYSVFLSFPFELHFVAVTYALTYMIATVSAAHNMFIFIIVMAINTAAILFIDL